MKYGGTPLKAGSTAAGAAHSHGADEKHSNITAPDSIVNRVAKALKALGGAWGGWQRQQQLLTAAAPTYVTLSYVFPADVVQVVYVSGESEHVAWAVPWRAIIAKRSKSGKVSLFRKPDNRYMVGVDAGQWASVQRVRQQAQASERERSKDRRQGDGS